MRYIWVALIILLCACQTQPPLTTELPFTTHDSVLRGDWVATNEDGELFRFNDLEASCVPDAQKHCISYLFSGTLELDDKERSISGEGTSVTGAGDENTIYTLNTERSLASFELLVERDGELWKLGGDYRAELGTLEGSYSGYLYKVGDNRYEDETVYVFFELEPLN